MNIKLYTAEELPPVNRREIFRYARAGEPDAVQNTMLDSCLSELLPFLTCRVVWAEYPVILRRACRLRQCRAAPSPR